MTAALIVGSRGQDGRILEGQLRARGVDVVGIDRAFEIAKIADLVAGTKPNEVYYLAAHHHSSEERLEDLGALFRHSIEVHVNGLVHVLEAIRSSAPEARLFYAASSHVFGSTDTLLQSETTPRRPESPYAITKAAGMDVVRFYREKHGVHASAGILYNHESAYRTEKFVTMRLVRAALQREPVVVGSLSALVDWGYAPDYTEAMQRIVALPVPDDFVVATGEAHSVADFAEAAFAAVGLSARDFVSERAEILARSPGRLVGDATKLRERTGWKPSVSFTEMVARIVGESARS